ncbi:MAG TPA: polysaccharide biosynthesis tyrosine autokinase, partial [Saprospiraceae bacterium]|nr:polysaccharide biosynthesis tyrosine autokinase [Saprospiraceae bacterium]
MKSNTPAQGPIIELKDLLVVYRGFVRNILVIVLLPVLTGAGAYFYAYKQADIFGATSQVMVKSNETFDYQERIYDALGYYEIYGNIPNQIKVITSRDLIEVALKRLDYSVSYFILGRLKTAEVFSGVPFRVDAKCLNHAMYEREIFIKIIDTTSLELRYDVGDREVVEILYFDVPFGNRDLYLLFRKTDFFFPGAIEETREVNYMIKVHSHSGLISKYSSSLSATNIEFTSIIELNLTDEISERAVQFLDTLAQVYIEYTMESKINISDNTIMYIDRQLAEVVGILKDIEDSLEHYKTDLAILDLPEEAEQYFGKFIVYEDVLKRLQVRLKDLNSLEQYILKFSDGTEKFLPSSFYVYEDDEFLQKAVEDLYTLQLQRSTFLTTVTDKSESVANLDRKINELKASMLVYIENSRHAIKDRMNAMNTEISSYQGKIKSIPSKARGLLNITRRLQVNEKLYVYLLEKRANTVIAKAGIIPETKIIERARSLGVVKPDKKKILIYGVLVGILMAVFIAFVREAFFRKIGSIYELKEMSSIAILGQVMRQPDASKEIYPVVSDPKSAIGESFRGIRANLQFFGENAKNQVVLVTSVSPGEGKTFCSVNLAMITAKAGKRVLLVELDMHKPRIYKALNISNSHSNGLSVFLSGRADFSSVIQTTEYEGLDVALCGPVPPNASDLVLSPKLSEFFEKAREVYDLIIVDTPPIGLISDGVVLMKQVDVNIFVLNAKTASRQEIKFIQGILDDRKVSMP